MKLKDIIKYAEEKLTKEKEYTYNGKFYTIDLKIKEDRLYGIAYIITPDIDDVVLCKIDIKWGEHSTQMVISDLFDAVENFGKNIMKLYEDIQKVNRL